MAKPQKETARHHEAFQFYYGLGDSRSLAAVAEKFGVTPVAAENWSRAFGWQARVHRQDTEIAEKVAEQTKGDIAAMQTRHLKILRAIQGAFVEKLKNRGVDPKPADFLAAAEYEAKMMGYSPETVSASAKDISEMLRLVMYVLHTTLPDSCPGCKTLLNAKQDVSNELLRLGAKYAPESPMAGLPGGVEPPLRPC